MPTVFLNYRRDDTEGYAGRLYSALTTRLRGAMVFMDVDNIVPGEDFVETVDRTLASCDVMLALIGRNWLTITDDHGCRRLDDENDFVRLEIARALGRDIRVVPVLVQDARMPAATDLPDSLKDLSRRQACELRHARWNDDVGHLIGVINRARSRATSGADAEGFAHSSRSGAGAAPQSDTERIGRYEVVGRIDRGTLSTVYRAYDRGMERHVALKILSAHLEDYDIGARFFRELKLAAGLHHPNIITIFDVDTHEGRPFVAMELVDGESLAGFIHRRAPIALANRLQIADGICAALEHAHGRGLVHGAVKPSSVLIGEEYTVKVINFGLTQTASIGGHGRQTMILGTPQYESPEQLGGQPLDHRTDIFSFGALLYELISYRMPFASETISGLFMAILNQPPRPLHEVIPGIDPELERLVGRALEKDPALRYQDVHTLVKDLTRVRSRLQA